MDTSLEHVSDSKVETTSMRDHGLGVTRAVIFIIANIAGSGVLALPDAASNAGGWIGIALVIVLCTIVAYAGIHLGLCWGLLEKHFVELRTPIRNPYPTIGERAFGDYGRRFVVVAQQLDLIGAGTVFLLLPAQIISGMVQPFAPNWGPCVILLLLAALVCPVMWLGTPKDFWGIGVMAMLTTLVACIVSTVQSVIYISNSSSDADTSITLTARSFFLGFGAILFAFGGSSTFPTIQNDMKDREHFPKSVALAFIGILSLYLPVAVSGFVAFGHDVESNVLDSLTPGPSVTTAEAMVAVHMITTFVIMINPSCQYFEMLFSVPPKFGWQRCVVRSGLLLLLVFIGETVQDFAKVMSLVGGSTTVLTNIVFPCLFFLRLRTKLEPSTPVPLVKRIFLYTILTIGVLGGLATTYSALLDIFSPQSFRKPCYIL